MAVCRNRSTKSAPDSLSISYFTGSPPSGISMMALTSQGGLRPMAIFEMSMTGPPPLAGRRGARRRGIAAHHRWEGEEAGQSHERRHDEEIEPADELGKLAPGR